MARSKYPGKGRLLGNGKNGRYGVRGILTGVRNAAATAAAAAAAYSALKQPTKLGVATAMDWASSKTTTRSKTKKVKSSVGNIGKSPGASKLVKQKITMGKARSKPPKVQTTYKHTNSSIFTSAQGKQGVSNVQPIMSNLFSDFTQASGAQGKGTSQYGTNFFELIPSMVNTTFTSTIYGTTDIGVNNYQFYLHKIISEMTITNFGSLCNIFTIYWCSPVKNDTQTPSNAWDNALVDERNGQIAAFQPTIPVLGALTQAGYQGDNQFYGSKPGQARDFKKHWNIKKINTFRMGPGEIIDLHTTIGYYKTIDQKYQLSDASEYLTGQTLVPMIVIQGAPVMVVEGDAPTTTAYKEVTYGASRVGVIHRQTISISMQKEKSIRTNRVWNGIVSSANKGYIIDEDGDLDISALAGDVADETGN